VTDKHTDPATLVTRQKTADAIVRALKARFAHTGAHSGAQELYRILVHYRCRQLADDSA
jgi:hypothetical protein